MALTDEQQKVLDSDKKNLVVSASAGSGKTFVMIEKLIDLICNHNVPVSRLLVLTFTKAAAKEMKSRLVTSMLAQKPTPFLLQQIDEVEISDISTIDSFCERIIRRNVARLEIDENFSIVDERGSERLKNLAFERAYQEFFVSNKEEFDLIYFAFKKNKDSLKETLFEINNYFDSLADFEEKLDLFLMDKDALNERAKQYILSYISSCFQKAKIYLKSVFEEELLSLANTILETISIDFNGDFYETCSQISNIILPAVPRKSLPDKEKISLAKEWIKEGIDKANNFVQEKSIIAKIDQDELGKSILKFYKLFISFYADCKSSRFLLDFADIERLAGKLLADEEITRELQNKYDYIFIDEYQDTNRLQESIIKPIAQGGHFTAVGDIKQGIYGFRNASMEIMQEDISSFSSSEEGEALFLKGNFRTDGNILNFVNSIFEKIMTEKSVGIDYKQTSMLEGKTTFERGDLPAISLDIVLDDEEREEALPPIYSVKEDGIKEEEKYKKEVLTIVTRIEEALSSQIYDAKNKIFRKVCGSDIALLFRNRSSLMKECASELVRRGFVVNADTKSSLLEDSEIAMLFSLLSLTLNMHDDISLASVMCSALGGFSIEELASIKTSEEELYSLLLASEEEKVKDFLKMIDAFAFNCQVYGISEALNKLFSQKDYLSYLSTLPNAQNKRGAIRELFKLIKESECEHNPSQVLTLLKTSAKQKGVAEGGKDAINLTTIHATKGLEYPIVLLCGCGESLTKPYTKNYIITDQFGFGIQFVQPSSFFRAPTPALIAGKIAKKKKEFIGELMVFYVAMTRAQNHLYIIGRENKFSFEELEEQNTYLKLIMFALGENFASSLLTQERIVTKNYRYSVISEIEEKRDYQKFLPKLEIDYTNKDLEDYKNFVYPDKEKCLLPIKNSVTSVLKLEEIEKEENSFHGRESEAIARGNAYHHALKILDFDKIIDAPSLAEQLDKSKLLTEEKELINNELLLKNILLIKSVMGGQKSFKEKEFIMKTSLENIGYAGGKQEVIVQGIVDFFSLGAKNILIDYKFSSISNDEVLKEKYEKQIHLYSLAIEKAYKIKIQEKYLLSLKKSTLIKF